MRKNKSDIFVTLAVIACSTVLLGALFIAIGGNPFAAPRLRFSVDMKDSGGLIEGSDVTYSGHVVGKVVGIEVLNPVDRLPGKADHAIRLRVHIHEKVVLPGNVAAKVKSASLLGSSLLALDLVGPAEIGRLEDGAKLFGGNGSGLDVLVPGASDLIAGIQNLVENLNTVIEGLGGSEWGQNAAETLQNLRDISAELKDALGGERGVRAFTEKLNRVADDLRELISGADGEGEESLKAKVAVVLENLKATTSGWKETFGAEGGVNARLSRIAEGIDKLVNGDASADTKGLREELPALAGDLRGVAEEARVFLVYAEYFAGSLAAKPRKLLFGDNDEIRIPSKDEILDYYRKEGETLPLDPEVFGGKASKEERSMPRRFGPKR
jgi:ABC-type transporter Mla subunit MlaD